MDNKILQGIALILFGILLCVCSGEINGTLLHGFSYFPFAAVGVVSGGIGIIRVFHKNNDDDKK